MMEETQALQFAKIQYSVTGYCKHEDEFKQEIKPFGTNTVITNCGVCGKEHGRIYYPKT